MTKLSKVPTTSQDIEVRTLQERVNELIDQSDVDWATVVANSAEASIDLFYDRMGYDSETAFGGKWTLNVASGEITVLTGLTDAPGGGAVRFGNNSGNDEVHAWFSDYLIPYDGVSLYEVGCVVRRPAGSGTFYCGVEGVTNDQSTMVNASGSDSHTSQHYFAASGAAPGTGWTMYRGYFQGWNTTGVGGEKQDSQAPGVMYDGAVFIRPMFIVNFDDAAGQTDVAALWVKRIEGGLAALDSVPATGSWMYDGAFSSTDADTVAWASGTLTVSDGTTYSITGANTGNMVARTYIYFDSAASTTLFQTTTTASSAVGSGKLLIAVAQNTADEAFFQVFGGIGGTLITANEIAANTITANEIAATLTYTGTIVLSTDGKIYTAGKTDFSDTDAGLYLGYDTSEADYVLNIGDATNSIQWDGTNLSVKGQTIDWTTMQSFTPGWTGFQTNPSGDLNYIDGGVWALIVFPSQRSGTASGTALTVTSLPAAITPSVTSNIGGLPMLNASSAVYGKCSVNTGSTISFNPYDSSGTAVKFTTFTASLTKGVQSGCIIVYPL